MGAGFAGPLQDDRAAALPRPASSTCAPINASGSRMRRIGRLRSEASPSKVAVTAWPPTYAHHQTEPVPALPKSSGWARRQQRADAHSGDAPVVLLPAGRCGRRAPGRPRRCRRRRPPAGPSIVGDPLAKQAEDEGRDARSIYRPADAARPLSAPPRRQESGVAASVKFESYVSIH